MSLIFITLFTNWIFIPVYGIVGAAMATAISLLLFNLAAFLFLLVKFKMQPFTIKTVLAVIIAFLALFLTGLLPEIGSPIVNILMQSIVILCIYIRIIIFGSNTWNGPWYTTEHAPGVRTKEHRTCSKCPKQRTYIYIYRNIGRLTMHIYIYIYIYI